MTEIFENPGPALPLPVGTTLTIATKDQDWQDSGTPGFWIKPLFEYAGTKQRTWLMKVDPGADAPLHTHVGYEQIYVIEGSFSDGINSYTAGDFAIRAPDVPHSATSTEARWSC